MYVSIPVNTCSLHRRSMCVCVCVCVFGGGGGGDLRPETS